MYQSKAQINGTKAHEKVDNEQYSTRKNVITALDVYSEKYRIIGKIDIYDGDKRLLVERKKHINKIYDGYIFQLYAQYLQFTASSGRHSVLERPFSEANGRPFVS